MCCFKFMIPVICVFRIMCLQNVLFNVSRVGWSLPLRTARARSFFVVTLLAARALPPHGLQIRVWMRSAKRSARTTRTATPSHPFRMHCSHQRHCPLLLMHTFLALKGRILPSCRQCPNISRLYASCLPHPELSQSRTRPTA